MSGRDQEPDDPYEDPDYLRSQAENTSSASYNK